MRALVGAGKMDLKIGQVTGLDGADGKLSGATVKESNDNAITTVDCDTMLPFFGLTGEARPGRELGRDAREQSGAGRHCGVRDQRAGRLCPPLATSTPYPGKLKLILSGFPRGAR